MLYLTFKHKGRRKHYYSDSIHLTDSWCTRIIHNFLDGFGRYTNSNTKVYRVRGYPRAIPNKFYNYTALYALLVFNIIKHNWEAC